MAIAEMIEKINKDEITKPKTLATMKSLGVSVFDAQGEFRGLKDILIDINTVTAGFSRYKITFSRE